MPPLPHDTSFDAIAAPDVAVIGAGPSGLIAAERLAAASLSVRVFDRMPSPGRKFLMAGRGGLNLTHSEPLPAFRARYGATPTALVAALDAFTPDALRAWSAELGEPTSVGSSGRVFPASFKASPLLRALLRRLDQLGVTLTPRTRWTGWDQNGALHLEGAGGPMQLRPRATLLTPGGASWPRLGSDGTWAGVLREAGVPVTPLQPANAGVLVPWSEPMRRHAGTPLKRIVASVGDRRVRGEAMVTEAGLEGGAIYALGPAIRAALAERRNAPLHIDLRPDLDHAALAGRLAKARRGASLSTVLRGPAGLSPAAATLVREGFGAGRPDDLSAAIKAVPLTVTGFSGLDRAISTAGGVPFEALDEHLMLRAKPGVFVAGEALDWDAPTGGYLLQACFATGVLAAEGIIAFLGGPRPTNGPEDGERA